VLFTYDGGYILRSLLATAACCFTLGAQAATSDLIREQGLAEALVTLKTQAILSPSDQLAFAGITFLRAIEKAYQTRWRVGYVENDLPIPLFANRLPHNPQPEPIEAQTLNELLQVFLDDMATTDAALAEIPAGSAPSFNLSLPDIWFDINMNGTRDSEEDFGKIALQNTMSPRQIRRFETELVENPDQPNPMKATIRFDEADLHWLRAYTHVLSGVSELVLAFDPAPEIQKALDLRMTISAQQLAGLTDHPHLIALMEESKNLANLTPEEREELNAQFEALSEDDKNILMNMQRNGLNWLQSRTHFIDMAAVIIETLRHQPDQPRIASAHAHLLAMTAHNRNFWTLMDQETDNDNEWIPNANQQAALGIEVPIGTGDAWQAILSDAEKMLNGELLIPFWRYAPGHGINIKAWVDNPAPLNVIGWAQGAATLPYAQQGQVITGENWGRFQSLVQSQSGLFVFMLN